MKAAYQNFQAKENSMEFIQLPPPGVYVGTIMGVRVVDADGDKYQHDTIELMVEITEGEYKGRFTEVYSDQKERWGADKASYKGIFKMVIPADGDEDWRFRAFEGNIWCVEESNPGYSFRKPDGSWDEQGMAGKQVGINIRNRLYNYVKDGEKKEGKAIEIARLETVQSVHNGKAKPAKDRDTRKKDDDEPAYSVPDGFTAVNTEKLPWA